MNAKSFNEFLNKNLLMICLFVLFVLFVEFVAGTMSGTKNREERLMSECMSDGSMTTFECKMAVSEMMRAF